MATIVTRAGKGAPLTHVEVDANFTNLNTDKIQSGDSVASLDINGGTIDGTVIGGSTAAAISGTTGQFGTSLNVDGTVTADGLTSVFASDTQGKFSGWSVVGANGSSGAIELGQSPAFQGIISYAADGNTRFIFDNSYGSTSSTFEFRSNTAATPKTHMKITGGGDISFYEDTGTTPKFFWDASAESLGIGTSSPAYKLDVAGVIRSNTGIKSITASGGQPEFVLDQSGVASWTIYNPPSNTALRFYNGVDRMTITSTGNVGIGTISPAQPNGSGLVIYDATLPRLTLRNSTTGTASTDGGGLLMSGANLFVTNRENGNLIFEAANATEHMRIDASGNVGIGTSSPAYKLDINGLGLTHDGSNAVIDSYTPGSNLLFYLGGTNTTGFYRFHRSSDNTAALDITAAGNVGIGTSSPKSDDGGNKLEVSNNANTVVTITATNDTTPILNFRSNTVDRLSIQSSSNFGANFLVRSNQDMRFGTNNTERMRIDASGNVGIGTSPTAFGGGFIVSETSGSSGGYSLQSSGAVVTQIAADSTASVGYTGTRSNHPHVFTTNNTERARIDASGNLLVGKTAATISTDGAELRPTGEVVATTNGLNVAYFNRRSSDGSIAEFRKDGTTVGSIGTQSGKLQINGNSGTGFFLDTVQILPKVNGSLADNQADLGSIDYRFDDIYATNGTIQTSDRNEKQDIEALSEAEQRVAVAAKGLLRKYRWKDAVEEKGDAARIHFGIIAQDLQAAFAAEGLDAGRYAMFISSTWTDEETGEERSRMGVRYPQLLAFIIAAI